MRCILHLYNKSAELISKKIPISKITALKLFDKLVAMKYDVPNDQLGMLDDYITEINRTLAVLTK